MENGVHRGEASSKHHAHLRARDALGAVGLAEGAISQHVGLVGVSLELRETNVFGQHVQVERGELAEPLAERCRARAALGERVTLVATAQSLLAARPLLRRILGDRLGVVFHAFADQGAADAIALGDLGWGVVFASGVEDSLDLSLAARRAAEDSGTPFLVVHERSATRHVEPVTGPSVELCEAFIGSVESRLKRTTDPAHPAHAKVGSRAFAERVPFALGSAMRELESFTSRRHDMLERSPNADAPIMLVGLGALGDSLLAEVERLRAQGHEVGAVKLTAYRPFPGARLIRALARALVVTVVEGTDEPLAQSNPLAREVKSAFADALTWAPEYPGIGRIPRIVSGVAGVGDDAFDLDAMVRNMLEGERGKRQFVQGADAELALAPEPVAHPRAPQPQGFSMRGLVADVPTAEACAELCSGVVASVLGLRARASVRALRRQDGPGGEFDLVAARDRPRGVHAPRAARLVALADAEALAHGNPLARLAHGGVVALPTRQPTAEALWAEVPPFVKAIVHDRGARLLGYEPVDSKERSEASWLVAATLAGVALAAFGRAGPRHAGDAEGMGRPAVDGSLVAREVEEALAVSGVDAGVARRAAEVARRVIEAHVEVPRSLIERDEDAVRLGRRDARAGER